jgi:hypothetical protein
MAQIDLVSNFEKYYTHSIPHARTVSNPATSIFNNVRPTRESKNSSVEEQKVYRSAVGSKINLIKYSRPGKSNVVSVLFKCMAGALYAPI